MERKEGNYLFSLNELYASALKARSPDPKKLRPGDFSLYYLRVFSSN